MTFSVRINKGHAPLPDFRQIPDMLWGPENPYNSDGDCAHPADRNWTELDLSSRRQSSAPVSVEIVAGEVTVQSRDRLVALAVALFLLEWTGGDWLSTELGELLAIREELIRDYDFLDKWERGVESRWKHATEDDPYFRR